MVIAILYCIHKSYSQKHSLLVYYENKEQKTLFFVTALILVQLLNPLICKIIDTDLAVLN